MQLLNKRVYNQFTPALVKRVNIRKRFLDYNKTDHVFKDYIRSYYGEINYETELPNGRGHMKTYDTNDTWEGDF